MEWKISEPCEEAWESMEVNPSGRFCSSCQKSVVDVSRLTRSDANDLVRSTAGGLCIRMMVNVDREAVFLDERASEVRRNHEIAMRRQKVKRQEAEAQIERSKPREGSRPGSRDELQDSTAKEDTDDSPFLVMTGYAPTPENRRPAQRDAPRPVTTKRSTRSAEEAQSAFPDASEDDSEIDREDTNPDFATVDLADGLVSAHGELDGENSNPKVTHHKPSSK